MVVKLVLVIYLCDVQDLKTDVVTKNTKEKRIKCMILFKTNFSLKNQTQGCQYWKSVSFPEIHENTFNIYPPQMVVYLAIILMWRLLLALCWGE